MKSIMSIGFVAVTVLSAAVIHAQATATATATAPAPAPSPVQTPQRPPEAQALEPSFTRAEMQGASVQVPMEKERRIVTVQVTLDGQGPFRFGLDTGASGGGRIDAAVVEKLGLRKVGQVQAGDPSGKSTQTLDLVEIGTLGLGGFTVTGVRAAVGDYKRAGLDGILAIDLFKDYLLTLDYPGEQVRIEKGELPATDNREVFAYESREGIPSIRLDLAGVEVVADVDSGNMGRGIHLPASLIPRLPLAGEPVVVGRARTSFNEFEIKEATLAGTASLGGLRIERPVLTFTDIMPHANVGHGFLRDFVVSIDQKHLRIRFAKPATAGA